jgi:hypothetical protein
VLYLITEIVEVSLNLLFLQDFKEAVNACSVEYLKGEGALRIISRDESTPRRVSMLQEMHFRNVSQRSILYKRTEEVARNLVRFVFKIQPKTKLRNPHNT